MNWERTPRGGKSAYDNSGAGALLMLAAIALMILIDHIAGGCQ